MFRLKRKAKLTGSVAADAFLQDCEHRFQDAVKSETERLFAAANTLGPNWQNDIDDATVFIRKVTEAREAMAGVRSPSKTPAATTKPLSIVASSLFLHDVWRDLISDDEGRERIVPVSGVVTPDGTRVMSTKLPVKMSEQSSAYVQLEPADWCRVAFKHTDIDQHTIMGIFHSHIMHGPETTRPSNIDIKHQDRIVKFGMTNVLGGIFNMSGHVRIFSTARDFQLHIHGTHFKMLQDNPREKLLHLTKQKA